MTIDAQSVSAMKPSFTFRLAPPPPNRRWSVPVASAESDPQPRGDAEPESGTGDGHPLEEPSSVHGGRP